MIRKFCSYFLLLALATAQSLMFAEANEFSAYHHKMPSNLESEVAKEKSVRLIVRYYDVAVDTEIQRLESRPQQDNDYKTKVIAFKAQRYGELKVRARAKKNRKRFKIERDYSHLPMNVVTIKGDSGLLELLADPAVAEVYRDVELHHFLAQSAPMVRSTDVLRIW
jgi:hypothetical protein